MAVTVLGGLLVVHIAALFVLPRWRIDTPFVAPS